MSKRRCPLNSRYASVVLWDPVHWVSLIFLIWILVWI